MMHSSINIPSTARGSINPRDSLLLPQEKFERHCEHYDGHIHHRGAKVGKSTHRDRIKLKLEKGECTYKDVYLKKL